MNRLMEEHRVTAYTYNEPFTVYDKFTVVARVFEDPERHEHHIAIWEEGHTVSELPRADLYRLINEKMEELIL